MKKACTLRKPKILQAIICSLTILHSAGAALSTTSCQLKLPLDLHCQLQPGTIDLLPPIHAVLDFIDQRLASVFPVIQKFKSTITSDPLGVTKTWVGSDICTYRGFFCDNPPDNTSAVAVASVDFNGFGLSAPSLDGFIDQLPDLALFHANSNNFSGALSPQIAQLKYLYELDVSNNRFSGPFPTAVLGMDFLIFLDIRFNLFAGLVPPQIFTQNLEALFINNNDFLIRLPDNIGATHVVLLAVANNKFNGPLPRGLFKALSLTSEILFINDQLTGCIPYEVGYLRSAVVFNAANNQLTGRLPLSLACLDKVEQLDLGNNLLFGLVPEMVCGLESLVNFDLSGNYFTNVGPMCRVLIERGVLDMRNNCIHDLPYQRSVQECSEFFSHPRFCPRSWSFNFLPCLPSHFSAIPQAAPSP